MFNIQDDCPSNTTCALGCVLPSQSLNKKRRRRSSCQSLSGNRGISRSVAYVVSMLDLIYLVRESPCCLFRAVHSRRARDGCVHPGQLQKANRPRPCRLQCRTCAQPDRGYWMHSIVFEYHNSVHEPGNAVPNVHAQSRLESARSWCLHIFTATYCSCPARLGGRSSSAAAWQPGQCSQRKRRQQRRI